MEQAGDGPGDHARDERAEHGHPDVDAVGHEDDADRAAGTHGAVDGQIGQVQHFERDVHANGHEAPDQALGQRPRKGVEQRGEKVHGGFLLFSFF